MEQVADLFDLVGFTMATFGLKVQDFVYPVLMEYMMVTFNPFRKSKCSKSFPISEKWMLASLCPPKIL